MQYAFILGRVYTLSIAELLVVLPRHNVVFTVVTASQEVLIIETEAQIDYEKLQKELGGVVKIVKIIDVVKKRERDSIQFRSSKLF
jgi:hypothetical protein